MNKKKNKKKKNDFRHKALRPGQVHAVFYFWSIETKLDTIYSNNFLNFINSQFGYLNIIFPTIQLDPGMK